MSLAVEHFVIRDVTEARGTVRVLRNHWWWCVGSDPRKAIFYIGKTKRFRVGAPQCNSNRYIAERVTNPIDGAALCQLPVAFVPLEAD